MLCDIGIESTPIPASHSIDMDTKTSDTSLD